MVEPAKTTNTQSRQDEKIVAKVVIVGDSKVGKSCLLNRFCGDTFTSSYIATIGADIRMKIVDVEGQRVQMQIWDISGQERFMALRDAFYRNAMGSFLVFACNDRDSFNNIAKWLKGVNLHASENAYKILVGNKCEVPDRAVSCDEARAFAEAFGLEYMEVSAKDKIKVDDIYDLMTKTVVQRGITNNKEEETVTSNSTGGPSQLKQEKKSCVVF